MVCKAPSLAPPCLKCFINISHDDEDDDDNLHVLLPGVVSAADTPDKKEHLVLVETGR